MHTMMDPRSLLFPAQDRLEAAANTYRSSPECDVAHVPPFPDILDNMMRDNERFAEIVGNIECALDRLLGSEPQPATEATAMKESTDGFTAQAYLALRHNGYNLARLQTVMGRLNRAV